MSTTWVPTLTFAHRLVMVRKQLGLTVEDAAVRCGIPHATWTTWERGTNPRNMATAVEKIEQGLGADRQWLMWGTGAQFRCTVRDPSDQRGLLVGAPAA